VQYTWNYTITVRAAGAQPHGYYQSFVLHIHMGRGI